ncbi:TetR/AcrR family transcriptional regulator [Pseudonocardia endophytica]|uniref:TetR family transcriptional regulator n=1 Tax=Pseudonocardia endophytica TaxID=401976 RepID=A0A4R1HWR7_PSEEN|nr:TetR/AcrR family transcriptional regulator [Pseudonocardia endophytica]TCK26798.1 TetR family transcriptional regulator [Pseudonocardia endophytica]
MARTSGLRERKKARTRQHIADTAARLFAVHGYDDVSVLDVARAADVSDQTVYNYFPAKHDLVLDRAEEIRDLYARTVTERPDGTSPAEALRAVARRDVDRHRHSDPDEARGLYPALCASSPVIRRLALEDRDRQTDAVAAAIAETSPGVHPAVGRVHAAALVAVFQMIFDRLGRSVLDGTAPHVVADELAPDVEAALDDLDEHFHRMRRARRTVRHEEPS